MSTQFPGFPPAGIQFLVELGDNNNKEWFTANKPRFERDLLKPAIEFIAAVGDGLRSISPEIRVDPRTNGSGSLMRIYRDTRFSNDKTPYKTSIAGMWWDGPGKKTQSSAFGFHLDHRGMDLMAGMFHFDKDQLKSYRDAVVDPQAGAELRKIVDQISASSAYKLVGERYKRVPSGYDPEHPNADLLLYNALYAHPVQSVPIAQVSSPKIVDICLTHFRQMAPVQRWLTGLFA